jgi:hypothetical protein
MVLLLLDVIDGEKQFQEISCILKSEEDAFDVISYLSTQAHQILAAYLIDRETPDSPIKLPIDVFDGNSFSRPIKKLQKEWRQILKKPVNS